ncbi:MAG TPA: hypothetical protein VGI97_14800 [Gemmatimonadaceae bacterium]|jgi:hypothetical protein
MAFVAAGAELLFQGVSAITANQKSQQAKGQAQTLIDNQQKQIVNDEASASTAAGAAGALAKKRAIAASGQSSTILTSPLGAGAAPTQRKTLLGL